MTASKPAEARRSLETALARQLATSLLPGDPAFTPDSLRQASRFVLESAGRRGRDEAALKIETETGPISSRMTRIAVVNDDMPFLVDSITGAITALGLPIERLVHPVVIATRDKDGDLVSVAAANGRPPGKAVGNGARLRESVIYIEAARADARTRVRLRGALESALADVRAAVSDWPAMREALAADAGRLDRCGPSAAEDGDLLRWFADGALTQLGHVIRWRDGRQAGALGVCRKDALSLLAPESYARAFAWFEANPGRELLIIKSNCISQVHRRAPLDLFLVPVRDHGGIAALSVHAGMWTSAALAAAPSQVPRLRAQLASLAARFGYDPAGHAGKALVHALARLPHDLLVAFPESDLERVATSTISLLDRPRPRVLLVEAPLRRHLFAFVWLPRESVATSVRLEIQAMLSRAAQASVLDWSLEVESASLALLRFVLDIREGDAAPDEAGLDAAVKVLLRGWTEAVEAELAASEDPPRAAALAARYAEAFPIAYRVTSGPAEAAADIERLRRLAADARDARLSCPAQGEQRDMRLKLYRRHCGLDLSDAVPMLENFGFHVVAETPTILGAEGLGAIHDFLVDPPAGTPRSPLAKHCGAVERAIAGVLNGLAEDDPFNRLITGIGLDEQETEWLRAWYRYLRQAGMNFGIATVVDALEAAPRVVRGFLDLFRARHDPAFTADRDGAEQAAIEAVRDGLAGVSAINDDRLLRQYLALVGAVVRTNAFLPGLRGDPCLALAFKIDSALVPGLPRPAPWREIFVHSRRVEGIHLRAGPIARGGLRWSDRRDDYRTEVLGLMKAQRVKNAVIVPTGAKGGFFPKQLPGIATDREGWLAEGKASYEVFVRSLLSLTDNVEGRGIAHPSGMIVRDGDDPYFVVAADKGTASFSDTANALAAARGFWLDDAFASGGSKGYDHKAMGITARGAWISVQRHFREMGVDVQEQPIRVAGCGDMSGDVFGNGMLQSRAIRLVAAFDHRDIFLDPDPDPAASWEERKRLFDLPRSSWRDYDPRLVSPGGGVFPRSLKSIPIGPEIRALLGVEADSLDPDSLVAAILRAPVDLLWFGGIGTYVKAAGEANAQVGDPANDALRVNGREVRASVIGEGANLGCTQAGRIEFALDGAAGRGGRINTDFIDNSAGVDCSDNEVNIKIALAAARRSGALTEAERVRLLARMTDEVAQIVLEDNRLQTLALSIAEAGGPASTPALIRLVEMLEERGFLDSRTEGIGEPDLLARRAADGQGLRRPELAVLMSCAKLALQDAIEQSALPDDPGLEADLLAAFPAAMRRRFAGEIRRHRLRREIIATKLANRIVNRLGPLHPFELVEEEGAALADVAAAFVVAERLFSMAGHWRAIEQADMPETARMLLFARAAAAIRPQMADLLRAGVGPAAPSLLAGRLAKGVAGLRRQATRLIGREVGAQARGLRDELAAAGAPPDAAEAVAGLFELDGATGIALLAADLRLDAGAVAKAFIAMGDGLGLEWAQTTAARTVPSDPWDRLLVAGLARDFQHMRFEFLRRKAGTGGDPGKAFRGWSAEHAPAIDAFGRMVARARKAQAVTPAMLARLAGQAHNLLAR